MAEPVFVDLKNWLRRARLRRTTWCRLLRCLSETELTSLAERLLPNCHGNEVALMTIHMGAKNKLAHAGTATSLTHCGCAEGGGSMQRNPVHPTRPLTRAHRELPRGRQTLKFRRGQADATSVDPPVHGGAVAYSGPSCGHLGDCPVVRALCSDSGQIFGVPSFSSDPPHLL